MRSCLITSCLAGSLVATPAAAQVSADEVHPARRDVLAGITLGPLQPAAGPWQTVPRPTVGGQACSEAACVRPLLSPGGDRSVRRQPDLNLGLDLIGWKAHLAGATRQDADSALPQLAAGIAHRSLAAGGVAATLDALGTDRHRVDAYVAASHRLASPGPVLHGSLHLTRFPAAEAWGSASTDQHPYSLQAALATDWACQPTLSLGAEIRFRPLSLSGQITGPARAGWQSVHLAWTPSRQIEVSAAWMMLQTQASGWNETRSGGLFLAARITP